MRERVIVIDPGERTGWVSATIIGEGKFRDIRQGVHPLKDFALGLYKSASTLDTIIYETWRLYPGMGKKMVGNDMQPAQLVGMIRFVAWLNPSVNLVSQGANLKKTGEKTMPPALKRRLRHSSEQHDKDALFHLAAYHHINYAGGTDA